MTSQDVVDLVTGALIAIGSSTVFVLALFLGFCIIFGFSKLRPTTSRGSMVVKSLEETVGQEAFVRYMPPDAPRGPIDVLKTPELLERAKGK
ncbi:MAG: hypothetical protein EHM55_14780 [Acidobacteria bacterium]|nr:MAG: hypothetical protein EHM55_14780 [Acidobacteriota bacterium]